MHVNKQKLTTKEKSDKITLIELIALNSLLTGVEPRVGHILHARNMHFHPKLNSSEKDPAVYKSIAYLSTLDNILSSILYNQIYLHLD